MLPYWLLFSTFAFGAVANSRQTTGGSQVRPMLVVAAILMVAMIGLRYRIGADWDNYIAIYYFVENLDFVEALAVTDPGYAALNWVVVRGGFDIWPVNLVCGAILSFGLFKFARRQPNPWLAILVAAPYLVIVVAMGYSRQAVAVGLVLAGLAVLDKSFLRFAIYVFCAAAFHKTAIVVMPLAALATTKNRIAIAASLAGMACVMFYLFVSADFDRLVTTYVENVYDSEGAGVRIAMNILPAGIFLGFQRYFADNEVQRLLWRNFSVAAFATLFLLWILPSTTVIDRIALYLIPLQIFILSRLPTAFHKDGQTDLRLVLGVILYSALIQFVWLNFARFSDHWLPYKMFFLSEMY